MDYGYLTLVAPILTLAVAIATRKVPLAMLIGIFAGQLIMESGLRGYSVGGAKVSEKHCGFIINTGNATAEDVKDVIWEVQRRVKERFQVDLEPEIKFL